MPRNMGEPGSYWYQNFKKEEHVQWINKLGNLTIIPRDRNAGAGNANFPAKKLAYAEQGKESPFALTREICEYDEWTPAAIEARHEKLKEEIRKLWWVDDLPANLLD